MSFSLRGSQWVWKFGGETTAILFPRCQISGPMGSPRPCMLDPARWRQCLVPLTQFRHTGQGGGDAISQDINQPTEETQHHSLVCWAKRLSTTVLGGANDIDRDAFGTAEPNFPLWHRALCFWTCCYLAETLIEGSGHVGVLHTSLALFVRLRMLLLFPMPCPGSVN